MYGDKFVFRCDEPGCTKQDNLGASLISAQCSAKEVLEENEWIMVGKYCYCPQHKRKHEND